VNEPDHHPNFLNLAALFEGALAGLAFAIGWSVGISPLAHLSFTWSAAGWGLAGALPMIALFLLGHYYPVGPFKGVKRFLVDMLGPLLDCCRWHELLLLSVIVGLCEEILFRGVLQPWLERWGDPFGLIASNVLFGLAHFVSPLYALLTGLAGLYLGVLFDATGERNLLIPILTHAAYDFVAFLIVVHTYRRERIETVEPQMDTDDGR
jgi:membrane protease YdiL (CAAX protease family)